MKGRGHWSGALRRAVPRRWAIAVLIVLASLTGGVAYGKKYGLPLVGHKNVEWSVGIYSGSSPFTLAPAPGVRNPVLSASDVTDVDARFVADPFLIRARKVWYLFVEVLNKTTDQGDIGYATSSDGLHWRYRRIVLDEPFHLSYPYVFEWRGAFYMIPETHEAKSIRLYRAEHFPDDWRLVGTLVRGLPFADSSLTRFDGRWWLFSTVSPANDTVLLYYADRLTGPWRPHRPNPVEFGDPSKSRGGGRLLVYNGRLYRFSQDDAGFYGSGVNGFEVTELSPTTFRERPLPQNPVVQAAGSGWNAVGMHQLDPEPTGTGRWIASVDGYAGRRAVYGLGFLFGHR